MTRLETINFLNDILLTEMPECRKEAATFANTAADRRRLLRALMNVRPPLPLREDFLAVQDELLQAETREKGIVTVEELTATAATKMPDIFLWQGDITRLATNAIVNAANNALLGCFVPGHACIDNAIHSAAGLQLRAACHEFMLAQGHAEPTGKAKITPAFNLPCRYVLHTVGPIVRTADESGKIFVPTADDAALLSGCYRSCLTLAAQHNLQSVAFCAISTGEFHFPQRQAAKIAVNTVAEWKRQTNSAMKIVFDVFKDDDTEIYRELLGLS